MSKKLNLSEDILFMAFRYALGRTTYVVSEIVETLTEQWDNLSHSTQLLIISEIKDAIDSDNAGHEMDKSKWMEVYNLQRISKERFDQGKIEFAKKDN